MKKIIILVGFIFIIALTMGVAVGVCAENQNPAAAYLAELGEQYYREGNTREAIHEFSKALLVDPNNEMAKTYLQQYGLSHGLYSGAKTANTQIVDLAEDVKNYRGTVSELVTQKMQLEDQTKQLQKMNLDKESQVNELKQKVDHVMEESQKEKMVQDEQFHKMKEKYSVKKNKLKELVKKQKEEVVAKSLALKEKEQKLASIDRKFDKVYDRSLTDHNQIALLNNQLNQAKKEALKLKLNRDAMLAKMEEYLYVRRNDLKILGDQLIYKEMDLTENEHLLLHRLEELSSLYESTDSYKEQINDREDLIKEKIKDIEFLKKKIEAMKTDLTKKKQLIKDHYQYFSAINKELGAAYDKIADLTRQRDSLLKTTR